METQNLVYKSKDFLLYKNDKNELIWAGVHSNKFIDSDEDILTEQAHKRFIELIYAKKVEFPHLFIWHIPVSVGECLWLAYDERGFLMSGGKVFKKFHKLLIALVGITDNMGMSHGMPLETVVYDDEGYIVEYISKEVSFLPAEEAANELTAFTANKRGEENDVIDRR